jgi:predicted deacylase
VDLYVARGSRPGPVAVVTAGVHGDEYEGPVAALRLAERIRPEHLAGSLVLVPVANPMAHAAGTRVSPEDGKNLARVFPGAGDGSVTEQLAAGLFAWIREAQFVIDLHSGGVEYDFAPLAGFYGPAAAGQASFDAARVFGLPHLWQLPETGGVLSCEAWRRGLTVVGCEYRGMGRLALSGVEAYVNGVQSCLAWWGLLPETAPLEPRSSVVAGDWQLAEETGFFETALEAGCRLVPGQPVARILSARGEILQSFSAAAPCTLLAIRAKAYVRKGDWGVLLAA